MKTLTKSTQKRIDMYFYIKCKLIQNYIYEYRHKDLNGELNNFGYNLN